MLDENQPKSDNLKTQGLFLLIRLLLFLIIVLMAMLIMFLLLRNTAYSVGLSAVAPGDGASLSHFSRLQFGSQRESKVRLYPDRNFGSIRT
ncbi:MAG: hypothetical protein C4520_11260 [Candidatus Abyssobacteria bacterium SURF_5]|uniref:Uncharacterized protein n=1 Tax=Abyssobacteria bacterium (strain SURF_5) TaxID=2093360 RepID=A0A3A4NTW0_ABYX5|nr:MAG: hypothetical protein C4520_11260 [Candidatus Abyssubacteria bacterium SURF_5]